VSTVSCPSALVGFKVFNALRVQNPRNADVAGDTDGMTDDLLKMAAILLMIVNWDSLDPENRMQFFGSSATPPWCYGAS
jgi:hypothetical protein